MIVLSERKNTRTYIHKMKMIVVQIPRMVWGKDEGHGSETCLKNKTHTDTRSSTSKTGKGTWDEIWVTHKLYRQRERPRSSRLIY